mgnify:CR=1 FL=1
MVRRNSFIFNALIFILIIFVSDLPAFQELNFSDEFKKWEVVSHQLQEFLNDPVANFSEVKKIDDLFYWTNIYVEINGGRYVNELFSRHFKVEDIDSQTLDIIYYLLDKYSCPSNWWNFAGIKPIISRLVEAIEAKPRLFFEDLLKRNDWKKYLKLIALDKDANLNRYCAAVPDPDVRAELLNYLNELEDEKRTEVQRLEEFLKDPENNFDKIKNIYFICSTMAVRDRGYVDENKNLPDEYFSPGIIFDYIKEDPDDRKIEILLHMIAHCTTSGLEPYVITELGAEIFFEYPEIFARGLSEHKNWKSIVYLISAFLFYRDPGYKEIISRLGNTDFENNLKSQLNFLSYLNESKVKLSQNK